WLARTTSPMTPASRLPITSLDVLSAAECAHARDAVWALRERWVRRSREAPAITLGASAGTGDATRPGFYARLADRDNPALAASFWWLYDRLEERLAELLGEPVRRTPCFALPGFVIYLGADPTPTARPPIHYDCQYRALPWHSVHADVDLDSALSLTLPLSLPPRDGSGL